MDSAYFALIAIVVVLAILVTGTLLARGRGYNVPGRIVVRCMQGHLFTTVWIPGGSFKAIRLGFVRFQYCPVGDHWTFVRPVKDSDLTPEERRMAERYHDGSIP